MLFFGKKSPEEKEADRLEKLRRHEGDRAFGGALITPVGTLALADICMVRLEPEGRLLSISSGFHKRHEIPYSALRGMAIGSESQIAKGESAITAEEIRAALRIRPVSGDAGGHPPAAKRPAGELMPTLVHFLKSGAVFGKI